MVFALASFTMNANTESSFTQIDDGCASYATNGANAEESYYGDMSAQEWHIAAQYYYHECKDAGGASGMLNPIFL
jgi:hypothetical protein